MQAPARAPARASGACCPPAEAGGRAVSWRLKGQRQAKKSNFFLRCPSPTNCGLMRCRARQVRIVAARVHSELRKKAGGLPFSDRPPNAARTAKPSSVPGLTTRQRPFLSTNGCPLALARDLFHAADHGAGPRASGTACACTRWGLPCPFRHRSGGALLPHRFTLTGGNRRRSVLCGTVPGPAAGRWALPTTLSYRARTFLRRTSGTRRRPFRYVGGVYRRTRRED